MRKLLLMIFLITAAAGGGYWWYENNVAPATIPISVKAVESQLRKDAAAVGFLNIEFAKKLEKYLLAMEESKVIVDNLKNDYGLFSYQLVKSGLDLPKQLKYVVAGVIADNTPQYAIALFGDFQLKNIAKRLELNSYKIENKEHKGKTYLEVILYNKDSCEFEQPINIYWDTTTILIGTRQYFSKLIDSYLSANKGEPQSQLHKYKLATGSISKPHLLSKGFTGAISVMLDQASKTSQPLTSVNMDAEMYPMPPGIRVNATIVHKDAQWAQSLVKGYGDWQAQMSIDIEKNVELKNLLESVQLEPDSSVVKLVSNLDKEKVYALKKIPLQFFSIYKPKITANRSMEPVKEVVVPSSEIKKYLATVDMENIPLFKAEPREKLSHAVMTGPFAAYLNGVRLGENNSPELNLSILSADIPNLFFEDVNEKGAGRLRIEDVVDKGDKTLLADKECYLKSYSDRGKFTSTHRNLSLDVEYGITNATKEVAKSQLSVRLNAGVKAKDIAKIKGKVDLNVPTKIDIVQMSLEKAKSVYGNKKFRIKLTDMVGSTVNYEVSGDKSMLIDVRARNAQNDYLQRTGFVSMQRLFDGGEIGAWNFAGVPKSIELVVAEKISSESYPFEITSLSRHELIPIYVKNDIVLSSAREFSKKQFEAVTSDKCSEQELEKSYSENKPFVLCIKYPFRPWNDDQYSGVLELVGPATPEINNNLSAVTFKLESIALAGANDELVTYKISSKLVSRFTASSNGYKSTPQLVFKAPENIDPNKSDIKLVKGSFNINLVKKLEPAKIDTNNIGQVVYTKSGLKIMYEGFDDGAYYIRVYGDEDRIVNVYGLDAEEREIKPTFPKLEYPKNRKAGYTLLVADINGKPTQLIVELAKSLDKVAYEFVRTNK